MIKEQESNLVSTILLCCENIQKLFESNIIKPSFDNKTYFYDFKNLYCEINEINFDDFYNKSLNESITNLLIEKNIISPTNNNNYYAYLKKVYNYIDNYSNQIIVNLNESMKIDGDKSKRILDISSFKDELSKIIKDVEKQDDTNLPSDILKIKLDLNIRLNVMGFNINKDSAFISSIEKIFGIKSENIRKIFYDKSNKSLYIFLRIAEIPKMIYYDIKNDKYEEYAIKNKDIKDDDVLDLLKQNVNNNIIIVHNMPVELKFTDNLYSDAKQNEILKKYEGSKKIFR